MYGAELSVAEALYLLDLAETTLRAQDLPNLAESFLDSLARLIQTPAAILYLEDQALPGDLNKVGGEPFYEEERLLLHNFAEEIAFALRNGKMFEVVVKSYCKQRQGLNTCKGCKRPLGSWTPCVKYRDASIEV